MKWVLLCLVGNTKEQKKIGLTGFFGVAFYFLFSIFVEAWQLYQTKVKVFVGFLFFLLYVFFFFTVLLVFRYLLFHVFSALLKD